MHILENYALSCGLKIDKPYILEAFFPIPVEKYITLHPTSKGSKSYDFWQIVVDILFPILSKNNISIIQIGKEGDKSIKGCFNVAGQTSINQVAFILHGALLHLGVDSFPTHIASSFDKKIVCLYSNNYINCVKPYWGDTKNHILLEPDRKGNKPLFAFEENPKTINTITPESIAKSVCSLLEIPYEYEFETLFYGDFYNHKMIEMVPDHLIDISQLGITSIIIRMDYLFNEVVLAQQLKMCDCSITTKQPINIQILKENSARIKEIIYVLEEDSSVDFIKTLESLNINYHLATYCQGVELDKLKLKYLDYKIIHIKQIFSPDSNEILKNVKDWNDIYYQSAKLLLSKGQVFPSKSAWSKGLPIDGFTEKKCQVINEIDFWKEMDNFYLLKKLDLKIKID